VLFASNGCKVPNDCMNRQNACQRQGECKGRVSSLRLQAKCDEAVKTTNNAVAGSAATPAAGVLEMSIAQNTGVRVLAFAVSITQQILEQRTCGRLV